MTSTQPGEDIKSAAIVCSTARACKNAMPNLLKTLLTVVVSTALSAVAMLGYSMLIHVVVPYIALSTFAALISGAVLGLLYGLETGLLLSYDLGSASGWGVLLVDLTWSFPNTVFGLILGNLFYPFLGDLSRTLSEGQGWVSYARPNGRVLQTLGTVNLGGAGNHERVHLWQARIFGPLYLPLFGASYVVTALLQTLWTITLGGLFFLLKMRDTPYLRPPEHSVIQGFFGWIYAATPFELWAYATE